MYNISLIGQPGNVNSSRLGISNFWDFNSLDLDRRNFLNNFVIKKLLIFLFSYSSIQWNNIFFHNKWFKKIKHLKPNKMCFYRIKEAKLRWTDYCSVDYYIRYKPFFHFSSKIQIMRTDKWICIMWYLYSRNDKQYNFHLYLKPKLLKILQKKKEMSKWLDYDKPKFLKLKLIQKIILLKFFLFFKFYNYKLYNNINTNLFLYNLN